ncbi:MAG: hypothetical protein HC800_04240 [Phormidesmis sp. RL_2_1]|nr:hypothetical protein [Phormidesmis sp. RL_2_1]
MLAPFRNQKKTDVQVISGTEALWKPLEEKQEEIISGGKTVIGYAYYGASGQVSKSRYDWLQRNNLYSYKTPIFG